MKQCECCNNELLKIWKEEVWDLVLKDYDGHIFCPNCKKIMEITNNDIEKAREIISTTVESINNKY